MFLREELRQVVVCFSMDGQEWIVVRDWELNPVKQFTFKDPAWDISSFQHLGGFFVMQRKGYEQFSGKFGFMMIDDSLETLMAGTEEILIEEEMSPYEMHPLD